jgi:hypothetical protein
MPFSLTCACGARLEIDDKFAGQQISCPDCQRPLETPSADLPVRRTNGLALASLIAALVGAFTIVGTLAAIVLGILALVQMVGRPERAAGRGYALAGILIGVVMTAGTLFAVTSIELFGLTSMMSEAYWQGKLDFSGPMEIMRTREGFAITRPSAKWGTLKQRPGDDHVRDDLLLVRPDEDAIVLCIAEPVQRDWGMEKCREMAEEMIRKGREGLFTQKSKSFTNSQPPPIKIDRPAPVGDVTIVEMLIHKKVGSEDKAFLVRVHKRGGDDTMFVVVAGTRRALLARVEPELREALNSFRILDARRD